MSKVVKIVDTCPRCGFKIEGETGDEFIDALLGHYAAKHPEMYAMENRAIERSE